MRILITTIVDLKTSQHNRIHEFIEYLSKNHEITVISINDWWKKGQIEEEDDYFKDIFSNAEVNYLTGKKLSPILQEVLSPFLIGKIRKKLDFDVHLNYGALISGYSIAKNFGSKGVPTVFDISDDNVEMIRNSLQIPNFLRRLGGVLGVYMLRKNVDIATKVTVTTTTLKETCGIPDEKTVVIPNGVDTNLFRNYGDTKEELGLDGFIIGYVGVLREWVDLEPVFMALKDLDAEIKMLVVGKEGRFEENVRLAEKCGVSDRVTFTGMVPYSQVPKYISAMDICLIPFKRGAISENALPLKLFEYMACEKPVISTELPGVKAIAGDKVMYVSDKEGYKEKVDELYKNEELRHEMGKIGREFVENGYSWEKIVKKLECLLEEVRS